MAFLRIGVAFAPLVSLRLPHNHLSIKALKTPAIASIPVRHPCTQLTNSYFLGSPSSISKKARQSLSFTVVPTNLSLYSKTPTKCTIASMISLSPASVLGFSALFTAVYQTCFYALSVKFQNDQFTDVGGVSNFIFLAFINFIICGAYTNGHKSILLTYVLIWGARLMTFLYLRIVQWGGHDRRLDSIRSRPNGALIFWISQAVWVFTTSLPVTLAMVSEVSFVSWTKDIIGGILFIVGVLLEAISDQSKLIQQQRNDNDGDEEKWIHGGVWNWSRHPNYFGEILIWSSIYLTAEPILILPWKIVALISPIFTSLLLLFVSGVPLLEVNADRKFAHRQDYIDYKRNTSVLIPIPPTVYARIPRSIQKTLLLDFDMYYHFDEKRQILTTNGEKEATTQ